MLPPCASVEVIVVLVLVLMHIPLEMLFEGIHIGQRRDRFRAIWFGRDLAHARMHRHGSLGQVVVDIRPEAQAHCLTRRCIAAAIFRARVVRHGAKVVGPSLHNQRAFGGERG